MIALPFRRAVKDSVAKLTPADCTLIRGRLADAFSVDEIATETGIPVQVVYAFQQQEAERARRRDQKDFERDPLGAIRRDAQKKALQDPRLVEKVTQAEVERMLEPFKQEPPRAGNAVADAIIQLAREPAAKPLFDALGTLAARAVPPDRKDQVVLQQQQYIQRLEATVNELAARLPAAQPAAEEPPKQLAPPSKTLDEYLMLWSTLPAQEAIAAALEHKAEFAEVWTKLHEESGGDAGRVWAGLQLGLVPVAPETRATLLTKGDEWFRQFIEGVLAG